MPATMEEIAAASVDELKDDDNVKASTVDPCYEYQTMGFHMINMDTMLKRFYRAADRFVSGDKVVAPVHFFCQHCGKRHKITVDEINGQIFGDPDPRKKGLHYNHLLLTKVGEDPDGAAKAGLDYDNGFTQKTETEFWDIVTEEKEEKKAETKKSLTRD